MKISTLLFLLGATATGIHLQSKEGEDSRKKLKKHIDNFTPLVNDVFKQLEDIVSDSQNLDSDEIRANVEKTIATVKTTIANVDVNKVVDSTEKAIKVASKKIRQLKTQVEAASSVVKPLEKMSIAELKQQAKNKKIKITLKDNKKDILIKLKKVKK